LFSRTIIRENLFHLLTKRYLKIEFLVIYIYIYIKQVSVRNLLGMQRVMWVPDGSSELFKSYWANYNSDFLSFQTQLETRVNLPAGSGLMSHDYATNPSLSTSNSSTKVPIICSEKHNRVPSHEFFLFTKLLHPVVNKWRRGAPL